MFLKLIRRPCRVILGLLAFATGAQAFAHPGHDGTASSALPDWHQSNGRDFAAYLLKSENGRAWFVNQAEQVSVIPIADLDDTGRAVVARAATRLRVINNPRVDATATFGALSTALTGALAETQAPTPEAAKPFAKSKHVTTRWDTDFLYVESDGLPDHPMMKGITAWQQQVPLPQPYVGANAWRLTLHPVPAKAPAMIKGRFLRGAIALAVNGIPIFNPQNNRGEISQEIGELDEWGGHCGRGDDYHYHATPMHLRDLVGKGMPVAYALDGYPIYGLTEPDGSPVASLDECHGHATGIGYHYHGDTKYPYVMAGFHGEVVERGGQVDPQPRDNPLRPALKPLRGATITGLQSTGIDQNELTYEVAGKKGFVRYSLGANGSYTFEFQDPRGQKRTETYQRRGVDARPREEAQAPIRPTPVETTDLPIGAQPIKTKPAVESGFTLRSSAVAEGGSLPVEYTGDGASATLPLEWSNPPAGTRGFAIVMHHFPGPGAEAKWYWVLYDLPAETRNVPKNVKDLGTLGTNSVNGRNQYAPPHSKGPGAKTYILTVYALSTAPPLNIAAGKVDREALLAAIKDCTLAKAELKTTYDRTSVIRGKNGDTPPRPDDNGRQADGTPRNDKPADAYHLIPGSRRNK